MSKKQIIVLYFRVAKQIVENKNSLRAIKLIEMLTSPSVGMSKEEAIQYVHNLIHKKFLFVRKSKDGNKFLGLTKKGCNFIRAYRHVVSK